MAMIAPHFCVSVRVFFLSLPKSCEAKKTKQKHKSMSQSCRAHLFFRCVFWFSKIQAFIFFPFLIFFSKIYWLKRYERHNKTHWTSNFLNSMLWFILVLYLVQSKIRLHISRWTKVVTTQTWHFCWRLKTKMGGGNACHIDFPICHKLWDIIFFLAYHQSVHISQKSFKISHNILKQFLQNHQDFVYLSASLDPVPFTKSFRKWSVRLTAHNWQKVHS